jgi:enoyl-CoA hydratase
MTEADDDVVLERRGRLGHIILNRPSALNALTHAMIVTITAALVGWADDDDVETVLISGAGDRGLCAGGDIVGIYHDARTGGNATAAFWADEYALNSLIARYPKPFVAIMDGVVLGGGVGVSAHGSVRVVTERTKVGMPEVGIGFVPDVGGTWLLSRAPGELGTHAALTGGMITGPDAIALGLADHYVPSDRLPALYEALGTTAAAAAVADVATRAPASALAAQRDWIDASYSSDDALEIVARLEASAVDAARESAPVILSKSPTSVSVALEALRRARRLDSLEEALDQEYRVGLRVLQGTEIVEGIRAQVIDKDRNPKWSPGTLGEVARADVEHYFASLGSEELGLSSRTAESERTIT